jgi:hypothetical protein
MRRVDKHAAAVVEENLFHQVGAAGHAAQHRDREVEIAEAQCARQLFGDAAHDSEMNGVPAVAQAGAGCWNDAPEKAGAACDADRDVTDQTVEQRDTLVLQVTPFCQDSLRSQVDGFAKCGGRHTFGASVEQLRPEIGFELVNAFAQAGLRDVEEFGCFPQAPALDSGDKTFELTQIHGGVNSELWVRAKTLLDS